MTLVYDKDGNSFKVPHKVDVKGWLEAGYTLEANKVDEVDLETPLNAYIDALDEELREDFNELVADVTLEVKKDGTFNAKTLKELDAIVEELKA